jgi:hypothetical protein
MQRTQTATEDSEIARLKLLGRLMPWGHGTDIDGLALRTPLNFNCYSKRHASIDLKISNSRLYG